MAAKIGLIYLCKLLLSTGHDASMTDSDGNTPLHYAVASDLTEVVLLLIAAGADLNKKNEAKVRLGNAHQPNHYPVHVSALAVYNYRGLK